MYMFNMLKTNLNVFIRLFINNVEECIELVRNIKCELGKMQSRFSRLIKSKCTSYFKCHIFKIGNIVSS